MNPELVGLSPTERTWYKPPADHPQDYPILGVVGFICKVCDVRWIESRVNYFSKTQDSVCFNCSGVITANTNNIPNEGPQ